MWLTIYFILGTYGKPTICGLLYKCMRNSLKAHVYLVTIFNTRGKGKIRGDLISKQTAYAYTQHFLCMDITQWCICRCIRLCLI